MHVHAQKQMPLAASHQFTSIWYRHTGRKRDAYTKKEASETNKKAKKECINRELKKQRTGEEPEHLFLACRLFCHLTPFFLFVHPSSNSLLNVIQTNTSTKMPERRGGCSHRPSSCLVKKTEMDYTLFSRDKKNDSLLACFPFFLSVPCLKFSTAVRLNFSLWSPSPLFRVLCGPLTIWQPELSFAVPIWVSLSLSTIRRSFFSRLVDWQP